VYGEGEKAVESGERGSGDLVSVDQRLGKGLGNREGNSIKKIKKMTSLNGRRSIWGVCGVKKQVWEGRGKQKALGRLTS